MTAPRRRPSAPDSRCGACVLTTSSDRPFGGLTVARVAEDLRLLERANALRESVGAPLPPTERGDVDRIRAALGPRGTSGTGNAGDTDGTGDNAGDAVR